MRKLIAAAAIIGVASVAGAVEGDFTLSGHVNAGMGFQKLSNKAASTLTGVSGAGFGPLGEFGQNYSGTQAASGTLAGGAAAGTQELLFFVDEAELDVTKEFSENIKARADLSFGRLDSGLRQGAETSLEQAYVTLNIPAGNGVEFLVGRFDAPIGFESVERGNNTLYSHSAIQRELTPSSLTGVKFYYAFSDLIDLHFYVVNNLRDVITTTNGTNDHWLPSLGFRLGFNWGDEGKKSTVGVSFAGGPETRITGDKSGQTSYLGDVDWNVWFGDAFAFGGELVYRNDNGIGGSKAARYMAGELSGTYQFNDQWDGTVRYVFATDRDSQLPSLNSGASLLSGNANGTVLGVANAVSKTQVHEITLGTQYHITDAAKMVVEARYDMIKTKGTAGTNGGVYGALVGFSYNF